MDHDSILAQPIASHLVRLAKGNLRQDGFLQPAAFLQVASGKRHVVELTLAKGDRHEALFALGRTLRTRGMVVVEALILFESWFVNAREAPGATAIRPSSHPLRQEAVNLFGRDRDNRRRTAVIVPFRREARGLVFAKPTVEGYAEAGGPLTFVGLVDDFFRGNAGL